MRQGIYDFLDLEKINSVAFLEKKLLAENRHKGWKIEYFPKVEGLLIQKRGNISIRYLVYSQRIHCWLVAERFLVCQPKVGESLAWEQLLNSTKLPPVIEHNKLIK